MTQITRYVYDEQGTDTVLGLPATAVAFDGEIDAGGIHIDDAYYLDDIQITGSNSTKQLQLLAQVLNIKRQQRHGILNVTSSAGTVTEVQTNININGTVVKKAYIINGGIPQVSTDTIGGSIKELELTQSQVNACQSLFSNLNGVTVDFTPVSYANYKQLVDNGQPVNYQSLENKILYLDENNVVHTFSNKINGVVISVITLQNDLENCAICIRYKNAGYTQLEYITSPGQSLIVTDLYANERSKLEATLQFSQNNVSYPRMITAGYDNQTQSYSSSFETGVTGTLHVSYGNNGSWTIYNNIHGDYNIHTYTFDKDKFYMDGTLIGSGPGTSFTSTAPFTIFGEANRRTSNVESKGRVYHMTFWQDDVLIADMYPVKDSNSVCGMYDVIRDKFFTPTNGAYTEP